MSHRFVHASQALAAGAVAFAILGACGIAPAPPHRHPIVLRPRRPGPEITIRSLTGSWVGARQSGAGVEVVTLSLVQSGDEVAGCLVVQGLRWPSDPAHPSRLDANGRFVLDLDQGQGGVGVAGEVDPASDRISLSISGLWVQPEVAVVHRQ